MKTLTNSICIALGAFFHGGCQTGPGGASTWQPRGGAGENIEVKAGEYDQAFQYKYGLLYRALADAPYTGRIVTVDFADGRAYVSNEDFWYGGRRHGSSTHWDAAGQKFGNETTRKDGGMVSSHAGGPMAKKCTCEFTQTAFDRTRR